ncbi:transcription factor Atoh7-a [Hydra vulgaris]|uniref:Transcription factor Atoh7-a n=1 Tax=Hydra vulgaris TaxID=6087 RepID=A0ABM4BSP6_HYDVU
MKMPACQPIGENENSNCLCPSPTTSEESLPHKSLHGKVDRSKRLKASARERRRRHVLNDALENLRRKVPIINEKSKHKLSKIEVLRMAIDYIAMLSYYLECSSLPEYDLSTEIRQRNYGVTLNKFSEEHIISLQNLRSYQWPNTQANVQNFPAPFEYFNDVEFCLENVLCQ